MNEKDKAMRELIACYAGTIREMKNTIDRIQVMVDLIAESISAADHENRFTEQLTALDIIYDDICNPAYAMLDSGATRTVEEARKVLQAEAEHGSKV